MLTYCLVKVNFYTLRIHFLNFLRLFKHLLNSAKNVAQSISCHAKILKKLCLVVLIILDMQTRTPITPLVLQITFTQYSLPDSMSNNLRQLSVRNNMWPLAPIPTVYWTARHGNGSTSVAPSPRTEKIRDCENLNFTRSLPSCRDLI